MALKDQLKELCRRHGLLVGGTKAALEKRLVDKNIDIALAETMPRKGATQPAEKWTKLTLTEANKLPQITEAWIHDKFKGTGRKKRAKSYYNSKDWLRRVDISHDNNITTVRASMLHSMRPKAKQIRGKAIFVDDIFSTMSCNCKYSLSKQCSHGIVALMCVGTTQGNAMFEKNKDGVARFTTADMPVVLEVGERPVYWATGEPIKEEEVPEPTEEEMHMDS